MLTSAEELTIPAEGISTLPAEDTSLTIPAEDTSILPEEDGLANDTFDMIINFVFLLTIDLNPYQQLQHKFMI